jgi:hypothetical protein
MSTNSLAVASFNYAGIQTNPFEYNDGSPKMTECSKAMRDFVTKYWGSECTEKHKSFSKLDQLHKGPTRYSICYRQLPFGLSKEEFATEWTSAAMSDPTQLVAIDKMNLDLLDFDWFCYTAVTSTFTAEEVSELFTRCYVDPAKKLSMTAELIQSVVSGDLAAIVIIQEFLPEHVLSLSSLLPPHLSYYIGGTSATGSVATIIISSNIDGVLDMSFPNFNSETTAIRFGEYLVVGSHYPSKSENITKGGVTKYGHVELHQMMMEELSKPENANFILGVDANHTLATPTGDPNSQHTSQKRRTFLQTQFGKAEKSVTAQIDYILHNGPMRLSESKCVYDVTTMSEKYVDLPHSGMPYDHAVRLHRYTM